MNSAALATTDYPKFHKNRVAIDDGLRLHVNALIAERDALDEEVRQLRAAVKIYTEVVRRLRVNLPQRAA